MSVVIETTLGDITIDLYTKERPRACLNFLKLCKNKYYNYNLFHTVSRDFIAQTGDPTGSRKGGESIFGVLDGPLKRYFESETQPRIKHTITGLVSFVGVEDNMIGSQFFITLAPDLTYLDDQHCVFGEVAEGLDVLELLNDAICDNDNRPYQDIRITHTVILDDPYPDLERLRIPSRSPSPSAEKLQGGRIAPDEEIDETVGKDLGTIEEIKAEREAKARATILEMVGDIPDADVAPPENVLFVCKLNPVTTDDDLEIIFSRFGKINSCEVIRDKKTGDSLQYAFIEFDEQKSCEDAYFKMDNVLIDDRRIHVDFSQSVSKVKWLGKGRGVAHFDERGQKTDDRKNDIGKGNYKSSNSNKGQGSNKFSGQSSQNKRKPSTDRDRSKDRERYSRERRNSRDRHQSSWNRAQVRNRSRSPNRRTEKYNAKRWDKSRYKPYRTSDRHSDWKHRSTERTKSRHYFERIRENQLYNTNKNRDRSASKSKNERDNYRRQKSKSPEDITKKSSNTKKTLTQEFSTSDDDDVNRSRKLKSKKSSSSESESGEGSIKRKIKSKHKRRNKKSDYSTDSSEEEYKKKSKSKKSKKKKKYDSSSGS